MREVLTGLGAGCEFLGIVLVASPELFPRLGRGWRSLGVRLARAWRRLLGFFGRSRSVSVTASAADALALSDHASALVSTDDAASLEEKVAFLLRQDRRTQELLNATEQTLGEFPARWRRDIGETRRELEEFVETRLERERDVHIRVRLIGIVFLLVGVPLLAVANVV